MKSATLTREAPRAARAPNPRASVATDVRVAPMHSEALTPAETTVAGRVMGAVPLSAFTPSAASAGRQVAVSVADLLSTQNPALQALAQRALSAMDRPAIATGHGEGNGCSLVESP